MRAHFGWLSWLTKYYSPDTPETRNSAHKPSTDNHSTTRTAMFYHGNTTVNFIALSFMPNHGKSYFRQKQRYQPSPGAYLVTAMQTCIQQTIDMGEERFRQRSIVACENYSTEQLIGQQTALFVPIAQRACLEVEGTTRTQYSMRQQKTDAPSPILFLLSCSSSKTKKTKKRQTMDAYNSGTIQYWCSQRGLQMMQKWSRIYSKIEQKRFGVYAIVSLWKKVDEKPGLRNHAYDERKIVVQMYKLAGRAFAKLRWKRLRGAKGSKEETKKLGKRKEEFMKKRKNNLSFGQKKWR